MSTATTLLRRQHRHLVCRHFSSSASSILSPSDPTAVLTCKQKSLAAHSLLRGLSPLTLDPTAVVSICTAASLSPSLHLDRLSLSLATSLLSPHPSSLRQLISSHLLPNRHVSSSILLFGQAHLLSDALSLFNSHPSTQSLNSLLQAAILSGDHPAVARFFSELPQTYDVSPDLTTFNTLLKSFSESGSTRSTYSLLDDMSKRNITPNATFFATALSGFYKEEKLEDVAKILELMKKKYASNPYTLAIYNVRIEALCKLKRSAEAKRLYDEMVKRRKMKPNWVSLGHLIVGFCKQGELEQAKKAYEEMVRRKMKPGDCGVYFSLVHYLCQGGDFEAALKVCKDAMGRKWVPHFKTMKVLVEGLVKVGKVEEGKEIVGKMKEMFPEKAEMWKEVEEGFPQ